MTTRRWKPLLAILILRAALLPAWGAAAPAVTVTEDESTFTLDNGIVRARAAKRSGDLLSLRYQGQEVLNAGAGHPAGYWSHNTARGRVSPRVSVDPRANGGERAEVSMVGIADGNPMGSGPGGSVVADIEIRYALGRGDPGLYTYSILHHPTNYPATSLGEARFCAKLNDQIFDWMTVDARRNMKMITAYDWDHGTVMNFKETRRMNSGLYQGQVEHKYDYSANQFDVRAWGWSSTAKRLGLWFVNPSVEYLSGGPTKVELSAHRDATFTDSLEAPAPPTLLNYWRGSHYGGSVCAVAAGEDWTKVVGPFLIYCNAGADHDGLWKDALAKADTEAAAWPFDWVAGVDYPHRTERGAVRGRLVLDDPQAPDLKLTRWLVGLAAPDYAPARANRGLGDLGFGSGPSVTNGPRTDAVPGGSVGNPAAGGRARGSFFGPRAVDWQNDAKHYEFWVRGDENGGFAIPNVRPGVYTLHVIADGVLGEFACSNVTVTAGQVLKLGDLRWQPVRFGQQVWDIGIPNRSGAEFFKGDDYFHWGWYLQYPRLFPHDVNYVVGRSDFRKDWFFEQVPHNENPANTTGQGGGRATSWSIRFAMSNRPSGRATLRLALCSLDARSLAVSVNGQSVGTVTGASRNTTVQRDGITGYWCERDVAFDASLLQAGENVLELAIPAGSLTAGVIYDYLRLELAAKP